MRTLKEMRMELGLSQAKFAALVQIPTANIQHWEQGVRKPPEYLVNVVERMLVAEGTLERRDG